MNLNWKLSTAAASTCFFWGIWFLLQSFTGDSVFFQDFFFFYHLILSSDFPISKIYGTLQRTPTDTQLPIFGSLPRNLPFLAGVWSRPASKIVCNTSLVQKMILKQWRIRSWFIVDFGGIGVSLRRKQCQMRWLVEVNITGLLQDILNYDFIDWWIRWLVLDGWVMVSGDNHLLIRLKPIGYHRMIKIFGGKGDMSCEKTSPLHLFMNIVYWFLGVW